MFQKSSKENSRKLTCLDEVSMVFLESFKGFAKRFRCGSLRGCVESISWGFQETFKGVSGVY